MTLTLEDRNRWKINGVRQSVINQWITNTLASAINRLHNDNIYLVCDKSSAHNAESMVRALQAGECESVKKVLFMLTGSAKYLSPLDNPLWHGFKEDIRSHHSLLPDDTLMTLSDTFYSLSEQKIKNAYRKWSLLRGTDEYSGRYQQCSLELSYCNLDC